MTNRLATILLLSLACAAARAQMHVHAPPSEPRVDLAKLPAPQQIAGIGHAHIPITTRSAQVQAWFDQGLALVHCFWDYEALRAFEQAVRLDPDCAMCRWGLFQALWYAGADAQAKEELARAKALSDKASDREQRYIRAESAYVEKSGEEGEKAYAHEMEALIDRYPDDLQARLLYAGHLGAGYDEHAEPRAGTIYEQMLLRSVLAVAPENAAANHYWIHAVEDSGHPERALESAGRLAQLAPSSGHIVHMPGHIYYKLGDYERARTSFLASMQVDTAYMAAQHVSANDDWNYAHNLSYLVAACAESGRYREARTHALSLAGLADDPNSRANAGFYVIQIGATATRLALRYGRWDEAIVHPLAFGVPEERLEIWARDYRDGLVTYARAMQSLEQQRLGEADAQARQLDALLWSLGEVKLTGNQQQWRQRVSDLLATSSLELRAALAAAHGEPERSAELFQRATDAERKLGYSEPPQYSRPAEEAQGAALLRAGHYPEARKAYQEALQRRPHSGFALYGIARSFELEGQRPAAVRAYREFLDAWRQADPDLPQLSVARAFIASGS